LSYIQLVSFIIKSFQYVHEHELRTYIYGAFPLAISPVTYLAPSSCDRNRPPQSQVACKLTPLSPIVPLYPSPWNPDPSWVFPRLNVHPIRAISQTHFPVYDTTRLASRKILIEQNIKKRTGPALWLLCGADSPENRLLICHFTDDDLSPFLLKLL
jgi:hypothetical protein